MPARWARSIRGLLREPLLQVSLAWLALCWPWLVGGKVLVFDALQEFYPDVATSAWLVKSGQMPWWNPYIFGGFPQLADPQAMTFSPTVMLPMLLPAFPSLSWFTLVVVAHLLLCGVGAVLLARSYGWADLPQSLFALTVLGGGVAASRLQHVPMTISYAFLPWVWLGLRRLCSRPGLARSAALGLAAGLALLQLTQITYLMALAFAAYGTFRTLQLAAWRERARTLGYLSVAAAVAAALSAPQWLATLAFLPFTNRAHLGAQFALAEGFQPASWSTLFAGGFFNAQSNGEYFGVGDITTDYAYLGSTILVCWLLFGRLRGEGAPHREERRFWLVLVLVAAAFAMGNHTPVYAALHAILPGMKLFRRPEDAMFLVVPAMAWLGTHVLDLKLRGAFRLSPHWATIGALTGVVGVTLAVVVPAGERPTALAACAGALALCALSAALLRGFRKRPALASVAIVVVVTIDLRLHNLAVPFNAETDRVGELYDSPIGKSGPPPATAPRRAIWRLRRLQVDPSGIPKRVALAADVPFWWKDGQPLHGVYSSQGYNPMIYSVYSRALGYDETPEMSSDPIWSPAAVAIAKRLLGVAGTISARPASPHRDTPALPLPPNAVALGGLLLQPEPIAPRVLNPVRVRRHTTALPESAAFAATDFGREVWIFSRSASEPTPSCAGEARFRRARYGVGEITLPYTATQSAWIVVNEIFAPGWRASVGDAPLAIERANGLFRAVCAPAGKHVLKLRFSPAALIADGWSGAFPELRRL